MAEAVRKESPLARFDLAASPAPSPGTPGIVAWERAFLGHINIRGDSDDPRFAAALADVLGVGLPTVPNTTATGPEGVVLWLGPDEWLWITAGEKEAANAASLRAALAGVFSSVTEVGSGQTVIVLQGKGVRELLSKDCPLDLHHPSFHAGVCAQTRLAKSAVVLRPLPGGEVELVVRRSFADYLWRWLADAATEYGFHPCAPPSSVTKKSAHVVTS